MVWKIQPTQFVDVIALMGDKVDTIFGVGGIG
jgi:5'-3' exonuclease